MYIAPEIGEFLEKLANRILEKKSIRDDSSDYRDKLLFWYFQDFRWSFLL